MACPAPQIRVSAIVVALGAIITILLCGCSNNSENEAKVPPEDERNLSSPPESDDTTEPPLQIEPPIPPAGSDPSSSQITEIAPGAGESEYVGPLKDAYDRIDPTKDGWESEAFSALAMEQLHALESIIISPPTAADAEIASIVAPTVSSDPLVPANLESTFDDGRLAVRTFPSSSDETLKPVSGLEAFQAQLKLLGTGSTPENTEIKLKIIRVEPQENGETLSEVLCNINRITANGRTQINARWSCRWLVTPEANAKPLLSGIHVASFQQITQTTSANPLFQDCTASVLGGNESYTTQFLTSSDHWRARLPRDLGIDPVANHGLAIGDINGDDLDDLYVCQQGGLPNRLFIQQPNGTLKDFSEGSGTDWLDYCAAALFIDLDNDGDRDLIVSQDFRLLILSNDGSGKFTLEFGNSTKAQSFSLAAADYDNDGLVDFYICGYNPSVSEMRGGAMGEPMPFHDANNGGPSMLWRNSGNFNFEDVTSATGIDKNNTRHSFAAAWEDYDNDGDQDLYVANDYGRNCLYRNDGARFTEVADLLRVQDTSSGMSVSWSDFNNDGVMDLYTSNMFSSAGNRITYQPQFKEGVSEDIRKQFQHIALGNSLFQGTRDPAQPFSDVGKQAGVMMARWAWGSRFVDFNNDGFDDILVANGFISTEDTGDL